MSAKGRLRTAFFLSVKKYKACNFELKPKFSISVRSEGDQEVEDVRKKMFGGRSHSTLTEHFLIFFVQIRPIDRPQ